MREKTRTRPSKADSSGAAAERKATKLSLKAQHLRYICETSTPIRKAVKAECQKVHKHSSLQNLTEGDFTELFTASLESWEKPAS